MQTILEILGLDDGGSALDLLVVAAACATIALAASTSATAGETILADAISMPASPTSEISSF